MRETKKKLLQETVTILKKLDKESLAIIRSNAEILRARDTLEEQKRGKEMKPLAILLLFWIVILTMNE